MTINYETEKMRLEAYKASDSKFWKPEPGQYKVKALSELEDAEPYEEPGKDPSPQAVLEIEIDGTTHSWTMGKGKTLASTYGQLVNYASTQGSLNGKEFTVIVTYDGKHNNYTIAI